jgi:hypothetical protein
MVCFYKRSLRSIHFSVHVKWRLQLEYHGLPVRRQSVRSTGAKSVIDFCLTTTGAVVLTVVFSS